MKQAILVSLVLLVAFMTTFFIQGGLTADMTQESTAQTGTVEVQVMNDLGLELTKGVMLSITNPETNESVAIKKKNRSGYYVANTTPGTYSLTAEASGHTAQTQDVVITIRKTKTVIFYLSPIE